MLSREYRNSRFLVVDANLKVRLTLEKYLRSFGAWVIDLAADGAEAVSKCAGGLYDVVICDYQLPGRSGQQVLEELRVKALLRHTSLFVMMSSETTREMVLGAIDHQPDAYINKPITCDVLKARLDALLVDNEVLYEIKHAMDMKRWSEAIQRCEEKVIKGSKYSRWCQKTLGELYLRENNLREAARVYDEVLAERPLIWAQVGRVRVYMAQAEWEQAQDSLRRIIEQSPHCLIAYDLMAEVLEHLGRVEEAQTLMADAVGRSPLSLHRHGRLGELSWKVHKVDEAAEAWRNAVDLGRNSVLDKVEYHIGLAQALVEKASAQPPEQRQHTAAEALGILAAAENRFELTDGDRMRQMTVRARACLEQGDKHGGEAALDQALGLYERVGLAEDVEAGLDLARTLLAYEKDMDAEMLLTQIQLRTGNDPAYAERIAAMREEPVSEAARAEAARHNRRGIQLFENGDVAGAIAAFREALTYSPRHVALNLNCVQVLLKKLESGEDASDRALIRDCLQRVSRIGPDHRQFSRYQFLREKAAAWL